MSRARKKYDIFISYSWKNKRFVKNFASELERMKIRVWFDQWEMRPGDRLRDRIHEGINNSKYFIVVLSEHSVSAPWVKNELDSAMMRELNENNVFVIPMLYGKITPQEIPQDLKGKLYLDLRNGANLQDALNKVSAFFQVDKSEYKAYTKTIRDGLIGTTDPIKELTYLCHRGRDQTIRKAAITGLSKYKTPEAMLGIAHSLLEVWGVITIGHAIKTLGKLGQHGGLILLSSTLFYDTRFVSEKLKTILHTLEINREFEDIEQIQKVQEFNIYKDRRFVKEWMEIIEKVKNRETKDGLIFGSSYKGIAGWEWQFVKQYSTSEIQQARDFVCSKLPGLDLLYKMRLGLNDYKHDDRMPYQLFIT